nr:hypothetical protein [Paludibacteraceae bacterium]
MKKFLAFLIILLCLVQQYSVGVNTPVSCFPPVSVAGSDFYTYFADRTMRIDYRHSGDDKTESFEMAKIASEGSWAGRT